MRVTFLPPKKFLPSLFIGGILSFYIWLIYAASHVALPSPQRPLILYSNQTRHDIQLLFCQALKEARQSIFLCVYGISDPQILAMLTKKSQDNLSVSVEFDPSASSPLKKILPPSALVNPIRGIGLMHRKIAVIDASRVLLGSANLTTTSLRHHANLVLGLYSPQLAAFLTQPSSTHFLFSIAEQQGELFLLPDPENKALTHLIDHIASAQKTIRIAMFTLTHPQIAQALSEAKQRGVDVSIAIDAYTARGASKKTLTAMQKAGICIHLSQGRELLHHKWAVIDDTTLVLGSANWTKAAFSKNCDFLLFLTPLPKNQIHFLNKLWNIIEIESIPKQPEESGI